MSDSQPIPSTHREVIDRWPSLRAFADDIGVAYGTAKAMRRRNSIPDEHRPSTVEAAARRDIEGISFELLTRTAPVTRRAEQHVAAA